MPMDSVLSFVAALAASLFAVDLWRDYRRRPRAHIAAYGAGMAMFAVASWALFVGLALGWTSFNYRVFFQLGAVLNIPFLALGSMFLVVGKKSGHVMLIILGAITAISTTLVATMPFGRPLPESGVPYDMFTPGFSPGLFGVIGSRAGGGILVLLALVSVFRFWKTNRAVVWGSLLIVLGTMAAVVGGRQLTAGRTESFALLLFATVSLIWAGYRVASGKRTVAA